MSDFSTRTSVVQGLAEALVSGPWREQDLFERAARILGRRPRWLRKLAERVLAAFPERRRPTAARVREFLAQDQGMLLANQKKRLELLEGLRPSPVMWPAPGAPEHWDLPRLATPGDLAAFLGLEMSALDWFSDIRAWNHRASDEALRHYRCVWRPKRNGQARLIEEPKARLKSIQRDILTRILNRIPPSESAHGFRAGRSAKTFAWPHVGRQVVIKLDLKDFFPSIAAPRIVALFLTAGYPEPVSRLLAGLVTHRVPRAAWDLPHAPSSGPEALKTRRLLSLAHLPQGAPTSPALANLCAYRLDARLQGLAASLSATYTRYADDLAFSGGDELARASRRFVVSVAATALEEGFAVNPRKTRVMRQGTRQQVAGVVVNVAPNLARDEYDRLKAILHNCLATGPEAQNREGHPNFRAHLEGRTAHLASFHAARGRKLKDMLDRIFRAT